MRPNLWFDPDIHLRHTTMEDRRKSPRIETRNMIKVRYSDNKGTDRDITALLLNISVTLRL